MSTKERRKAWAQSALEKCSEQTKADIKELIELIASDRIKAAQRFKELEGTRKWVRWESFAIVDIVGGLAEI